MAFFPKHNIVSMLVLLGILPFVFGRASTLSEESLRKEDNLQLDQQNVFQSNELGTYNFHFHGKNNKEYLCFHIALRFIDKHSKSNLLPRFISEVFRIRRISKTNIVNWPSIFGSDSNVKTYKSALQKISDLLMPYKSKYSHTKEWTELLERTQVVVDFRQEDYNRNDRKLTDDDPSRIEFKLILDWWIEFNRNLRS